MKIAAELAFVGSAYHGWQSQKNAESIQKTVGEAAEKLFCCPCKITGCSRTDSGVHALSYICTVENDLEKENFDVESLPRAFNTFLPRDIAVKKTWTVPTEFHPRYDAQMKEYEYRMVEGTFPNPFLVKRAWFLRKEKLNLEKMEEGAKCLVGTHDFSSFCAAGGSVKDKVRTIYSVTLKREGTEILLDIKGDGFLYNMVRIIVGTLVDYESGKISSVEEVLSKKDRSAAGKTAPPDGLYLKKVYYSME